MASLQVGFSSAHNKTPSSRDGVLRPLISVCRNAFYDVDGVKLGPYALATLPLLMQVAHTRIRLGEPFTIAFTTCRLTFQRRRVTLCA